MTCYTILLHIYNRLYIGNRVPRDGNNALVMTLSCYKSDIFHRFLTSFTQTDSGCYGATGLPKGFGESTMDNSRHLVETQPHPAAA